MSIQTQIDRIITAVDAAHAKVEAKGGTTARPYLIGNLADAIDTIPTGTQLPTLTNPGTASDALSGKEFIDGSGNKVTGTIATKTASNLTASGKTVTVPAGYYASQATKSVATATQATPSIEVSSAGLITAKATQSAGYVAAGTKSATKQLSTQGAQTITPGTADKTIASGKYLTGAQTIKGDANLLPANIKSGVSIFGVAGSFEGSGGVSPQLIVTAPAGSTITAVNGEETVTGVVGAEGTLTLDLPAFGEWTVTATLDGKEASTVITIKQKHQIELQYGVTFNISGGHGETVTAYVGDLEIGLVQLDATGEGSVFLEGVNGKTVKFVGGLSGYPKTVIVGDENEITVNVYPDGALYWLGREFEDITGGWRAIKGANASENAAITKNENSIRVVGGGKLTPYYSENGIATENKIDLSEYTTLKTNITEFSGVGVYLGVVDVYNGFNENNPLQYVRTASTGQHEYPVSSHDGEFYTSLVCQAESSAFTFNKVWLD